MSNSYVVVEQGSIDDIPGIRVIAEERDPKPPPKLVEQNRVHRGANGRRDGNKRHRLMGRHVGQDYGKEAATT